jgi:hypothetical protein
MVTLAGRGNPAGRSFPPARAPVSHSLSAGPGFAFAPNRDIFPMGLM